MKTLIEAAKAVVAGAYQSTIRVSEVETRLIETLDQVVTIAESLPEGPSPDLVGRMYRLLCNSQPHQSLGVIHAAAWQSENQEIVAIVNDSGWANS